MSPNNIILLNFNIFSFGLMDFGLLGFDLMGPPQLGAGLGVVLRNFKQLFRCFVPFSVYWLFNLMVFGLIAFGLLGCILGFISCAARGRLLLFDSRSFY